MTEPVKTALRDGVLIVTLDRPKANAIDTVTSRKMGEVFQRFSNDPNQRVAILTGGGDRFFSAGWDLKAAASGNETPDSDYGVGGFGGITELFSLQKPVICAMNGLAVGGGFELALAADMIVADERAEAWLPEIRLGIMPDGGGVLRLPRRLPRNLAMELLLTCRKLSPKEGFERGLYNRVAPAGTSVEVAMELAREILEAAPLPVMAIKEIVNGTEDLSLEEAVIKMRGSDFKTYKRVHGSEDSKEGPLSFTQKRAPVWKGR